MDAQAPPMILIEDDEVTLDLYRRELSKSFTVFAFSQIDDIPDIVMNQNIRAVVIEPEINSGEGWEWIHTLSAKYTGRCPPILVCTTRDIRNKDLPREVTRYMTKPVLPKTLREKTLEVIRESERQHKYP